MSNDTKWMAVKDTRNNHLAAMYRVIFGGWVCSSYWVVEMLSCSPGWLRFTYAHTEHMADRVTRSPMVRQHKITSLAAVEHKACVFRRGLFVMMWKAR